MAASCDPVRVDPEQVQGLQSLLEPDAPLLQPGHLLPPLWHWVALPRWSDPALTGPDGHPRRPAELGETPVRRMFAGGEVTFGQTELRVGDNVTVSTEVGQISQKSGRSGDFVLATFTSTVSNLQGEVVLTERQDVVYTEARPSELDAPSGALPIVGRPLLQHDGATTLVTDPTVLLRFSSLTANAHRIHVDLDYAREVERLPGLLVHGPLINLALAGLAATRAGTRRVSSIQHRNLSPLFVGQTAALTATETAPSEITAEATSPDGRATSRVVVHLEEEPS